ncbi:Sigma 54 modulation protein / S30EA ribosomal protein [Desulfonatronum thiosulfatophilum]|uniref:Sigma 54 modulation protein / S30EA ribosomal protein n=1 Tax=Desulfonatronum thiosulfatophilum TaxID=617002 RepID=A0A1G6A1S2_9BACT|nr:HPF/RaiA family ribosome-associated protein [Desulfonatronum thiosulfatophilum]SDB02335.1 Sigma 54 modulation protein / S30EA ribosomal protein [Desulfonatronum thiosulfatophilum]
MIIQVNTDKHIEGREKLSAEVQNTVEESLAKHRDHVTRVEVHLSDENSLVRGGDNDKRCMMEARLKGRNPIAVTHKAGTLTMAVEGAANKLETSLGNILGKLKNHQNPAVREMKTAMPATPDEMAEMESATEIEREMEMKDEPDQDSKC